MATISKEELQECFLVCYDSGYYKKLNENKIKEFYNCSSIQCRNRSECMEFVVAKIKDRYFALERVNYNSINCRGAYDLLYEVEPKVRQITEWVKKNNNRMKESLIMNKHNNDRSRDKIDSILYRARKNEADKILGETFKVCGCFFMAVSIGVVVVISIFLFKLISVMF